MTGSMRTFVTDGRTDWRTDGAGFISTRWASPKNVKILALRAISSFLFSLNIWVARHATNAENAVKMGKNSTENLLVAGEEIRIFGKIFTIYRVFHYFFPLFSCILPVFLLYNPVFYLFFSCISCIFLPFWLWEACICTYVRTYIRT